MLASRSCWLSLLVAYAAWQSAGSSAWSQIMIWRPGQTQIAPVAKVEAQAEVAPRVWTITPAAEPIPNLKFKFWESMIVRSEGSATEAISQARHAHLSIPKLAQLQEQYAERADFWGTCPLPELPASDLPAFLQAHARVLKLVHVATERSAIEMHRIIETDNESRLGETINLVQDYRHFARLLALEARMHLAQGRVEDAIRSVGVGFRLGQICEVEQPNIVSKLVQFAICGLMQGTLEEIVQHPQCPNLYWALASIPDSYWSMRIAYDGEVQYSRRALGPLLQPLPPSVDEMEVVNRLVQSISMLPQALSADAKATETQSRLLAGLAILAYTDRGRERLQEMGMSAADARQLDPATVVMRSTQLGFEAASDRMYKWTLLNDGGKRLQQATQSLNGAWLDPADVLLGLLLPAIQAAESASLRTFVAHRREMVCEALRAYAAANGNRLPDSLKDLQPLPAPLNPQSGQAFEYQQVSDTEAVIRNLPTYPGDSQAETRIILRANQEPSK